MASFLCRGPPVDCLDNSWAKDLRLISEVEAGVNFRPAGRVRRQVAGSIPRREPVTGARQGKGSVVTPPGLSWCRTRVTWTRIGHQAINGV